LILAQPRSGARIASRAVVGDSVCRLRKSLVSATVLPEEAFDLPTPVSHSFSVVLEPQPNGGFTVLVPALPEVVTEGDTEPEALARAEEAIRAVLEYRRAHGLPIPPDASPEIRRVTVAA
jgi:antitoxin HicB